jgi:hypothetical protein
MWLGWPRPRLRHGELPCPRRPLGHGPGSLNEEKHVPLGLAQPQRHHWRPSWTLCPQRRWREHDAPHRAPSSQTSSSSKEQWRTHLFPTMSPLYWGRSPPVRRTPTPEQAPQCTVSPRSRGIGSSTTCLLGWSLWSRGNPWRKSAPRMLQLSPSWLSPRLGTWLGTSWTGRQAPTWEPNSPLEPIP